MLNFLAVGPKFAWPACCVTTMIKRYLLIMVTTAAVDQYNHAARLSAADLPAAAATVDRHTDDT